MELVKTWRIKYFTRWIQGEKLQYIDKNTFVAKKNDKGIFLQAVNTDAWDAKFCSLPERPTPPVPRQYLWKYLSPNFIEEEGTRRYNISFEIFFYQDITLIANSTTHKSHNST